VCTPYVLWHHSHVREYPKFGRSQCLHLHLRSEGSMLHRNVGIYLPNCTMSQPRKDTPIAIEKTTKHTWSDNKVRELIMVKVLHTSLLNIIVTSFKVLPFGSYATMPTSSPSFKTILELILRNDLQSCRRILMSSKCLPFNISFIFGKRKMSLGARASEQRGCSGTVICLLAKNSFTDSDLRCDPSGHFCTHFLQVKIFS
jgi:hypothetical protein